MNVMRASAGYERLRSPGVLPGSALQIALSTVLINLLALALPVMSLQVYDRILIAQNESTLWVLATGATVAVMMELILRIARTYLVGMGGMAFEQSITAAAMRRIVHADLHHAMQHDTGEYVQQLSAIARLRDFYSGQTLTLLIDLPFVGVFLGVIAYMAGQLAWVPTVLLLLFLLVVGFTGRQMKHALRTRNQCDDKSYAFLIEALGGIHTVKSLGLEHVFHRRYEAKQAAAGEAGYHLSEANGLSSTLGSIFGQLMLLSVATVGAPMAVEGTISMGTLIACMLLTGRIMQPVQRVMGLWMRFQDIELAAEKLAALEALPVHEVEDDSVFAGEAQGWLECENVYFSLPGEDRPLLDGVNLTVQPGECVIIDSDDENALTGLLELIAGLYAPNAGSVRVDGGESCRYSSEMLVQKVAYLATEGVIFRGTILENLTQFQPEKEMEAREMAKALGIDRIITKLPSGYETMLEGAAADPIPPGLKQRIAMARVLASKPRLVLFCQADRSLDKEGHAHVLRALSKLKGKVTMLLVTADPELLRLADRLCWIKDGQILDTPAYPILPPEMKAPS